MPVIYSTASNDNAFPVYEGLVDKKQNRGNASAAVVRKIITIKGRANVKNQKTFITPKGVATTVSKEALECLKKDDVFMRMVKDGFMAIDEKADRKPDQKAADRFAKGNLKDKDKSAQKTEKDFADMKLDGMKAIKAESDGADVDEDEENDIAAKADAAE